ncbi:23S rRNA pseudouridine(1911/1915/1917) synthase RluD [Halorhodospira halochloris]|uniref:23S rRNA pseudouridine(1911/1915/1917) synthase RluD n=1 Tax=Halorhodospira halochloris TaxID=1052 RepID=UPI001EE95D61|nr:23S rRNA pseudouridine(1911/1915/1917) synthase RluD [Halorhodospira halochloris]MCG5529725.1 23S rRNA pseudouridine(1911/1915/1917) synthase RluD [Halorhodospira halochloris]MCG5548379.1 23S rRNA pseudouridine(1911/1915/1917) synthase RluD [Halorhodospira halochloris]
METQYAVVPEQLAGQRFDRVLAQLFPDYSRSRLQQWVKSGQVTVDGQQRRVRDSVKAGEQITLVAKLEPCLELEPEAIDLPVVAEDEAIIVIDKPAGLVVHPGAGNHTGTLVNALLYYDPDLECLPRAGIVHRLDKETSGLMVVARTAQAHHHLVEELQQRRVGRAYEAIVVGTPTAGGKVDAPIARHPRDRKRMAVVRDGRPAVSHYRVAERFSSHTRLSVELETGRTHQIRVHMAHIGLPLLGDPVYGRRPVYPKSASDKLRDQLDGFRRQALHACKLRLAHPLTGEQMEWYSERPADMQQLLEALREG